MQNIINMHHEYINSNDSDIRDYMFPFDLQTTINRAIVTVRTNYLTPEQLNEKVKEELITYIKNLHLEIV